MKFLDIINESEGERLLKRAKTIFKAYKEGTITRSDGVSFSYVLDNNIVVKERNGELELYGSVSKIVENTYCPINERYMTELIENRFRKFYISTDLRPPSKDNIHKFQGKKPWELSEDAKLYTKEDPSEEKRVRTIFKALKKGVVKVQHPRTDEIVKFRYNIDNVSYKWEYYNMMEKQLTIVTDNFPGEGITIYCDDEDIVDKCTNNLESMSRNPTGFHLREMFVDKLKSKFDTFNVSIQVNKRGMKFVLDKPKEPINENHEEYKEKQIKKGKTVYNALKKGTIGSDDPNEPRFSYVLSDDFSIDMNNLGILIFTDGIKIKELNRECNIVSTGYMQSKIRDRFEQFDIILTNRHLTSHDIEPWERPTINEEEDNNITEKDRKKIELIYGLFKRGKYTVEDILYNYVLPDEYWIYDRNETGELIVVLTMDPTQKMKLYAKIKKEDGNLYHREVPVQATQYASLYDDAKKRIKEKFERFNIEIVF